MKKFLLMSLAAFSINAAIAQESMVYGPCTDNITKLGVKQSGVWYSCAVKISGETAKALKGSKLTEIQVGLGSMTNKTASIFVSHSLDGEYEYTQEFRGKVNNFNKVTLDTPYECDGEEFYLGYDYLCTSMYDYPIGVDYPQNSFPDWEYYATWLQGDPKNNYKRISDGTDQHINLSIKAVFEGENLPSSIAYPINYVQPQYAIPGEPATLTMSVINMGAKEIESLEVSYINIDGDVKTTEVNLESPIGIGELKDVPVTGITLDKTSESVNLEAFISKVNGETNQLADIVCVTNFESLTDPYPCKLVIEEYTGVDCGWCPRGYVGMEYMRETYPDDVILLAVHNYDYPADPMHCESYLNWVRKYIKGAPQATVNRINTASGATKDEFIADYNTYAGRPCIAKMEVTAQYKDDNSYEDAVMEVKTTFNRDFDSHDYALAFAVTEDNVGPHLQANYYSGGQYGSMEGFSDLARRTPLVFNDVARHIWGWDGHRGSIPNKIEAGKENVYKFNINLKEVNDHRNAHVIALLINRETGEIITGAKNVIDNAKDPESGISAASVDKQFNVFGGNGTINVEGEFNNATVYSINGTNVATLASAGSVELSAGVYVVSVETTAGTETFKVIVK